MHRKTEIKNNVAGAIQSVAGKKGVNLIKDIIGKKS